MELALSGSPLRRAGAAGLRRNALRLREEAEVTGDPEIKKSRNPG